jgi:hypothetical protein
MPTIRRRSTDEDVVANRRRDRVVNRDIGDPDDDVVLDDDDDDVLEEERKPARKDRAARNVRHSSSQDREEDDDEPPRRSRKSDIPEGVRSGWDGAEQTVKSGGDSTGVNWLKIEEHVELVAFLEDAPLTSFRQHWLETGEGKSRPYLCPGSKCPICGQGDNPAAYYIFNVLYLSGGATPEVRALQINTTAYKNLKEVFADRKTGTPVINAEGVYASIKKAGKGFQTRTTFAKVKERDLEDDWDEIFEYFDLKDLPGMLDDALDELYTIEEVSPKATPRRELEKLAKYLDEPDDED